MTEPLVAVQANNELGKAASATTPGMDLAVPSEGTLLRATSLESHTDEHRRLEESSVMASHFVDVTFTAQGDITTFDQNGFKSSLATLLGVSADRVVLKVSAASVYVMATITVDSQGDASTAALALAGDKSALSTALGVTIEAVSAVTTGAQSASARNYVTNGWARASDGRLAYPPLPIVTPIVFGPDDSTGASSVNLPQIPRAVSTPSHWLPPDCSSSGRTGCLHFPRTATVPGLVVPADLVMPTFTKVTSPTVAQSNAKPTNSLSHSSCTDSTCDWGDADGDGDIDFFSNGLYLNDGSASFTLDTSAFPGLTDLSAYGVNPRPAWGDANNDGHLDLFIAKEGADHANELWINDGSGRFTAATSGPSVGSKQYSQAAAWADLDGDGDMDLFVANSLAANELWINEGGGTFTAKTGGPTSGSGYIGNVAWGDANGDGVLDLYIVNTAGSSELWIGDGTGSFSPVTGASDSIVGTHSDPQAAAVWGDANGDGALDLWIGLELWLNDGTSGGTFAPATSGPSGGSTDTTTAVWGDANGDGALDLFVGTAGLGGSGNPDLSNVLWMNDGFGTFTKVASSPSGGNAWTSTAAWADVDGDGDLDLFVGNTPPLGGYPGTDGTNELWINEGGGTFTAMTGGPASGAGVLTTIGAWADVDGDGDQDLFVGNMGDGNPSYGHANELWINSGSGTFTAATGGPVGGNAQTLTAAWADVDGDGDQDLIVGNGDSAPPELWINDGSGAFTASASAMPSGEISVAVFGDVDGDGDLDLFTAAPFGPSKLWINDGSGGFTEKTGGGAPSSGKKTQAAAWADADGDGDLDLYLGNDECGSGDECENELWVNDGSGELTRTTGTLAGAGGTRAVAWGDVNGDGRVDLFVGNYGLNGAADVLYIQGACPSGGVRVPTGGCGACGAFSTSAGGVRCIECPAHQSRSLTGACEACPPGSERFLGSPSCTSCNPGSYWINDAACAVCAVGSYATASGSVACSLCPSFSTTSATGATSITACECDSGRYSSGGNCLICPTGHYCTGGSTTPPVACPAGTFNRVLGASSVDACVECPVGSYCAEGSQDPSPCRDVLEQATTKGTGAASSRECTCVANYYFALRQDAATGIEAPFCERCVSDKVDCDQVGSNVGALAVRSGMWRASNTSGVAWVKPCFNPNACLGAQTVNGTSANATLAGRRLSPGVASALVVVPSSTFGDGLCMVGHKGPFCAVCADNYIGGSDKDLCTECGGNMAYTVFVGIVIVSLLAAFVVYFIKAGNQLGSAVEVAKVAAKAGKKGGGAAGKAVVQALATKGAVLAVTSASEEGLSKREKTRRRAKKAATKGLGWALFLQDLWKKFKVKVKIMVSLYQVLQGLGGSFSIPYPKFYGSVTGGVGSVLQIELPSLVPAGCVVPINFYGTFVFSTTWPLVIYAMFFFGAKALQKLDRAAQAEMLIDGNFFLMFLLYPGLSGTVFSIFKCVEAGDGSWYLRADSSLLCSTPSGLDPQFTAMCIFALVMILIHVIGYPLVYAYLFFWRYRTPLINLREQELTDNYITKLAQINQLSEEEVAKLTDEQLARRPRVDPDGLGLPKYVQNLVGGYEARTYWFEIFEMIRKVLLVGIPGTFEKGGNMQLVWGLLVCFITAGMYMSYSPFIIDSDDQLQQLAQLQIFITLAASLGLRSVPQEPIMVYTLTAFLALVPLLGVIMTMRSQLRMVYSCCTKKLGCRAEKDLSQVSV